MTADVTLWTLFVVFWLVSPGSFIAGTLIFEGRLVPMSPSVQFASFYPGDFFLGIGAAGLVTMLLAIGQVAGYLWWPWQVGIGALVVCSALGFQLFEMQAAFSGKEGAYHPDAVLKFSKLWHNIVICIVLGWAVAASLVHAAVFVYTHSWQELVAITTPEARAAAIVCIPVWLVCLLVFDNLPVWMIRDTNERSAFVRYRADMVHPAITYPIWDERAAVRQQIAKYRASHQLIQQCTGKL